MLFTHINCVYINENFKLYMSTTRNINQTLLYIRVCYTYNTKIICCKSYLLDNSNNWKKIIIKNYIYVIYNLNRSYNKFGAARGNERESINCMLLFFVKFVGSIK